MKAPWKILVVDDDEGIHSITRMVFRGYEFDDRPIELINASSGSQAKEILNERNDIAVTILDVVMETDHEGLNLVTFIREQLHNQDIRIILRTGHPGFAPEAEVIIQYDINDYLSKAELSASRLITSVVVALRSYRDIQTVKPQTTSPLTIATEQDNQFLEQFSHHLSKRVQPVLRSTSKLAQLKHKPMVGDIVETLSQQCQQLVDINTLIQPLTPNPASQVDIEAHLDSLVKSYLTQAKQESWIIDYDIAESFPSSISIDSHWFKSLLVALLESALCNVPSTEEHVVLISLDSKSHQAGQQACIEISVDSGKLCEPTLWQSLLKDKLEYLSSLFSGSIKLDLTTKSDQKTGHTVLVRYSFII